MGREANRDSGRMLGLDVGASSGRSDQMEGAALGQETEGMARETTCEL